jgi:hypothetical protein
VSELAIFPIGKSLFYFVAELQEEERCVTTQLYVQKNPKL